MNRLSASETITLPQNSKILIKSDIFKQSKVPNEEKINFIFAAYSPKNPKLKQF